MVCALITILPKGIVVHFPSCAVFRAVVSRNPGCDAYLDLCGLDTARLLMGGVYVAFILCSGCRKAKAPLRAHTPKEGWWLAFHSPPETGVDSKVAPRSFKTLDMTPTLCNCLAPHHHICGARGLAGRQQRHRHLATGNTAPVVEGHSGGWHGVASGEGLPHLIGRGHCHPHRQSLS